MKKALLLAVFLLFPVIAYAQPAIVFNGENFNFGNLPQGDSIQHTFEFTNAGDKELTIERLVPS
jgi:hypothetical protein